MIFIYIILSLLIIISLLFSIKLIQLKSGNKKVSKEIETTHYRKLLDIGSVKNLSILPLIDFHTDDDKLKTEPGVSYLIKADDTTILMDVGFNKKKEHPSPLLHNAKRLEVSLNDIDLMFISHRHLDHVGGMQEQKKEVFSLSLGNVSLPEIPVYSPVNISPSHWNPGPNTEIITEPKVLKKGIASIGVIPRNLLRLFCFLI